MKINLSFHKALSGRRRKGNNKISTPSGVTYEQFFAMSDDDKADFVFDVINNPNIVVPDYLDKSATSKVMYALGMNNKPQVVSDSELDKMSGEDLYRSVYDSSKNDISGTEILDQIRYADYTQLSSSGGSVHGRAVYFATNFEDSMYFSLYGDNPVMMRAKINPNAKIMSEKKLTNLVSKSDFFQK